LDSLPAEPEPETVGPSADNLPAVETEPAGPSTDNVPVVPVVEEEPAANLTQPENTIRTTLTLDGTVTAFNLSGDNTTFTTTLSGALEINEAQVNMVQYYEGSVVIIYDIAPTDNQTLDALELLQFTAYEETITNETLGYPIMGVETLKFGDENVTVIIAEGVILSTVEAAAA
jgi:hypothetical protein